MYCERHDLSTSCWWFPLINSCGSIIVPCIHVYPVVYSYIYSSPNIFRRDTPMRHQTSLLTITITGVACFLIMGPSYIARARVTRG